MIALPYRTATQRQSLTTMAQTERAANQGPAKFPLKNYILVEKSPNTMIFRNLLRESFVLFSKIII